MFWSVFARPILVLELLDDATTIVITSTLFIFSTVYICFHCSIPRKLRELASIFLVVFIIDIPNANSVLRCSGCLCCWCHEWWPSLKFFIPFIGAAPIIIGRLPSVQCGRERSV
jgi:Na+-translocating ferredoxin:NAD+ oxidoreductase RnfE subunit